MLRLRPSSCDECPGLERLERGSEHWADESQERVHYNCMAGCKLTFPPRSLSNPMLQLPTQLRLRTDQPPQCRPCAARAPHPACPQPASGPTPWCPRSTSTSPRCRPALGSHAPDQSSRSCQQHQPSHLPTSMLPTSTGRLEGGPSVACHHPAPPTRDANQMRRKMKR